MCQEASATAKHSGDAARFAKNEINIATIHYRMGSYDRSIEINQSLVEVYNQMGDTLQAGFAKANNALNYIARGELDTALQQLLIARATLMKHGSPQDWLSIDQNLGAIYAEMGMPERGLPYTRQGLATIRTERDTFKFAPAYGNLAYTFQQIGDFDQALVYYDSSLYFSRLLQQDAVTYVTLLDMADGFQQEGEYSEALKHFREYHDIQLAVLGKETRNRIAELEVLHETEQQRFALAASEQKVLALEQEAQIRNQRLVLIAAGLLSSLLLVLLIYRQWRRDVSHRETQKKLIDSELENERLASGLLSTRLESQREDLTDFALDIERKNRFSRELADRLRALSKILPAGFRPQLNELIRFASGHDQLNEQLEVVQENVDQVNHEFHQKLMDRFPDLTSGDRALAGLLRLNLTNKEVASIRGISTNSAKMARYRLRKKMGLEPTEDVNAFLQEI